MPSIWFRRARRGNSAKPVALVNMCLQQIMGDLFHNRLVMARADISRRTDIDAPVVKLREFGLRRNVGVVGIRFRLEVRRYPGALDLLVRSLVAGGES